MRRHITDVHGKEKVDKSYYQLECEECGERYKTRMGLCYHIESKHTSDVHYCALCIKRYQTRQGLQRHMETDHDKLEYEQRLLKGKKLLDFMVEECVPADIMPREDMELINLYRSYIYQKVDTWMDNFVPL